MAPDETPVPPPQAPKADQTHAPTEAELSRIAREAVRQPADPRLDKQLERMGLTDAPAAPSSRRSRLSPWTQGSRPSVDGSVVSSRSSGCSWSLSRS